jgi:predicted RecA/RadA family phage recombinase
MTETKSERRPRRDADGRLVTVGDLLGVALAGLVTGIVVLLAFEGIMALARAFDFGSSSGWLALILPVWLFTEEFRAAGYGAYRIVVAVLAAGFGIAVGMTLAGLAAATFPPLVSGAVGALGLTVVYCLVWFYGLRWLSHRAG